MRTYKFLASLAGGCFVLWFVHTQGIYDLFGISKAHAFALSEESQTMMNGIVTIMGFATVAMNVLMWVLFRLLGLVLDPAFMFDLKLGGGDGPLLVMLHNIWQLTRDIMNIIFAILLVLGAVITIVKANTELLKAYRAKFVIAIILINFSWFIPRVVLDVSQVLTYTIYQIPSLLPPAARACMIAGSADGTIAKKPCEVVDDVIFFEETKKLLPPALGWKCFKPLVCYHVSPWVAPAIWDHNPIINGLIVNHGRLSTLVDIIDPRTAGGAVPVVPAGSVGELLTFLIRQIIIFILHVALFFPMLAMVVAFLIRIPILWLTMAFMPVAFMGFVIGDKIPNFNPVEKIWKRFLTAAFLPAMVAVPLTVGFVMLNAGAGIDPTPLPGFTTFKTILPFLTDTKDLWQMIWLILALMVMWMGVFGVLKQDEMISRFTEPIKGFGENLGKIALKAPLSAPVIPFGTGKTSVAALLKTPGDIGMMLSDLDRTLSPLAGFRDNPKAVEAREAISKAPAAVKANIELKISETAGLSGAPLQAKLDEIVRLITSDPTLKDKFNIATPDQIFDILKHKDAGITNRGDLERALGRRGP